MSLKDLTKRALSLPPHIALAKSVTYAGRIIKASVLQIFQNRRSSYPPARAGEMASFVGKQAGDFPTDVLSLIRQHRFDLLGSGWVKIEHTSPIWQLSPGNRGRGAVIRQLIDPPYIAIDWQSDFKSGYRWRADRLAGTLRYGHEPGVDVKVPWELARFQHLPWLALAGGEESIREFRNQVLDFAAANPPGYGVNWLCTMDVAIRAANILIAYDLFVGKEVEFDEAFLEEFHALILAHGKHIMANLEWHDDHRANHFLADIVGLLFVAAYLPKSDETGSWLVFSIEHLIKEVERQFTPDGANFEASTSYHRLSAEMVVYATALALGLDDAPEFPTWYFERLERMAEFIMHVTKPSGHIVQIGDNDSGRFFKICPSFDRTGEQPREQHLDHRATVAAINGLFGRHDFADFSSPDYAFETAVVSALARGQKITSYLKPGDSQKALGVRISKETPHDLTVIAQTLIIPPDANVLNGLVACAYPDFGLFIWRSPRFFLSVRCGPVGQNGNGGHGHNDQLAIELMIDGEDWICDPGTYLYTPSPGERDAYRSVHAHAAPKIGQGEPARLDLGLFRLEDKAHARCLSFGPDGFEGVHTGYGVPLHRRIELQAGQIRIVDMTTANGHSDTLPITINDGKTLRKIWKLDLPFSRGYGLKN